MIKLVIFTLLFSISTANAATADLLIELGKSAEVKTNWEEAAKHYKAVFSIQPLSLDQRIEAKFLYGRALLMMGKKDEGSLALEELSTLYDKNGDSFISVEKKSLVAQARFILNEDKFSNTVKPDKNVSLKLNEFIAQREDNLSKLKTAYDSVMSIDSPEWTIAVLFRLGLANAITAQTILNAQVPQSVPDRKRDEFYLTLRNRGLPYEDRAIVLYKKAITLAEQKKLSGEWVELTKIHLGKISK